MVPLNASVCTVQLRAFMQLNGVSGGNSLNYRRRRNQAHFRLEFVDTLFSPITLRSPKSQRGAGPEMDVVGKRSTKPNLAS
jgi:hypothetical protein